MASSVARPIKIVKQQRVVEYLMRKSRNVIENCLNRYTAHLLCSLYGASSKADNLYESRSIQIEIISRQAVKGGMATVLDLHKTRSYVDVRAFGEPTCTFLWNLKGPIYVVAISIYCEQALFIYSADPLSVASILLRVLEAEKHFNLDSIATCFLLECCRIVSCDLSAAPSKETFVKCMQRLLSMKRFEDAKRCMYWAEIVFAADSLMTMSMSMSTPSSSHWRGRRRGCHQELSRSCKATACGARTGLVRQLEGPSSRKRNALQLL